MRRGCGNSAIAAASLIAAALTVSPAPAVACSAQTSGDVALGGINGAPCLDVLDGALGTVTVGGSVAASIGAPITYFYSVGSAQGFSVIRQTADTTNSTLDEIITTSPVNIGGNLLSINPQADILIQNISNGNRFATISRIVNNSEYRGDTFLFNYSMILDVNSVVVSNFVNNIYIYFTMNAIDNFGTISNLYNNGYMIADLSAYQGVSFPGSAVRNLGVIGTLYNQGLMSAPRPILNGGRIETFINTGQIVGTGGYDVGNLWIIVNFHNASTIRLTDRLRMAWPDAAEGDSSSGCGPQRPEAGWPSLAERRSAIRLT